MKIIIATRESPLALWQAEFVKTQLLKFDNKLEITLLGMTTKGDQLLSSPLSKIGGKGLFVKELEAAILEGRADIAVHSMKDVPMNSQLPNGLCVPVILEREDPRDAFVSNHFKDIDDLPLNARVGTCSLRRKVQIHATRPDLQLIDLRGNVNTRLKKLDDGDYDAIILACAGLKRLGFENRITHAISQDYSLPAVGQGAIGIECRTNDHDIRSIIAQLNHENTANCVAAERAFNATLNGGCQAPIAGYAEITDQGLWLRGLVGDLETGKIIFSESLGAVESAQTMGKQVALNVLNQGADTILNKIQ